MDNRKIGIFDSGIGGLTVLSEIYRHLPNEEIVYFGDNARNPYGEKSKDTVTFYCRQIINFLTTRDIKIILIACNTATISSLNKLCDEFDIPIIGVVNAGVESALEYTKNNKIGIIGTGVTISSNAHVDLIKQHNKDIEVYSKACPLLVNLVEDGLYDTKVGFSTCKYYLDSLISKGIDTLVLACTHFQFHKNNILKIAGENITIVDPAVKTVQYLKDYLEQNDMLRNSIIKPKHEFYVSGDVHKFDEAYKKLYMEDCFVQNIEIESY